MGDKEGGSSFLIGFIIGAVAGIAVGFLYAPKSGKETRALLKEKVGEVREKATEMTEKAKEVASETGRRVRERLEHRES
jgi:gas vesicle protein